MAGMEIRLQAGTMLQCSEYRFIQHKVFSPRIRQILMGVRWSKEPKAVPTGRVSVQQPVSVEVERLRIFLEQEVDILPQNDLKSDEMSALPESISNKSEELEKSAKQDPPAGQVVSDMTKHIMSVMDFKNHVIRDATDVFRSHVKSKLASKRTVSHHNASKEETRSSLKFQFQQYLSQLDVPLFGQRREMLPRRIKSDNSTIKEKQSSAPGEVSIARRGSSVVNTFQRVTEPVTFAVKDGVVRLNTSARQSITAVQNYRESHPKVFYPVVLAASMALVSVLLRIKQSHELQRKAADKKAQMEFMKSTESLRIQKGRLQQVLGASSSDQSVDISVFDAVRSKGGKGQGEFDDDEMDGDSGMTPEIKAAWSDFVKQSRLSEGEFWSQQDVDDGFEKIHIDFDSDDEEE